MTCQMLSIKQATGGRNDLSDVITDCELRVEMKEETLTGTADLFLTLR